MKARTVIFGTLAIGLLLFIYASMRPAPISVDVEAVGEGPLMVTVADEGRTRVQELFVISAPVTGRLLRIEPEVGDNLTKDQTVLATLLPSAPSFLDGRREQEVKARIAAAEAALQLAKSEVARAEAELTFARAEEARYRELARTNAASASLLDRAKLQLSTAQSTLKSAQSNQRMRVADMAVAKAALIDPTSDQAGLGVVVLKTPVDGVVLRLLHESEGVVAAGTPLMHVGDLGKTEIAAEFLSRDAVKISVGDRVLIEGWGGEPIEGRVQIVEPFGFTKISALGVEEQRVKVIIDFVGDKEKAMKLGHGYRVEPRIVIWERDSVMRVPVSALFRQGADWAVYINDDGAALLKSIKIGRLNGKYAEVLSGLDIGQQVIIHPPESVSDGVALELRD